MTAACSRENAFDRASEQGKRMPMRCPHQIGASCYSRPPRLNQNVNQRPLSARGESVPSVRAWVSCDTTAAFLARARSGIHPLKAARRL